MLDNVGLRYPHRASGAKAPRTLRPLPLLRLAVSATGGAHLCSIQYYLRFWLSICCTSLAVSALRIMRYCHRNRKRHVLTSLRDGSHAFFFSCSLRQFSLATRQSSGGVRWPRPPPLFSRQPSRVSLPRTIFPAKVPHFPPCHRAVFNIDHIFCG